MRIGPLTALYILDNVACFAISSWELFLGAIVGALPFGWPFHQKSLGHGPGAEGALFWAAKNLGGGTCTVGTTGNPM